MLKLSSSLSTLVVVAAILLLSHRSIAAEEAPSLKLAKTFKLGGDGGWDYATLDADAKLLFLPRSTHTMVVDTTTGKTVADFGKLQRGHGAALVPDAGRGFVTDGNAGTVTVFDLKTYAVLGAVPAAEDADGIIFDPASHRLLVSCGDANALIPIDPKVDPKSGKADAAVPLGGKPEFLASDGQGRAYVNLVDKNVVAVIDTKAMKLLAKWPTGAGEGPVGLALDAKAGRLYVGCRNLKLVVMSAADGKVLADLPIGRGVDAVGLDAADGTALASCGDGTITGVKETAPGKFAVTSMTKTAAGARTMAVDPRTGTVYLPAAEMDPPAQPNGRPRPKPDSFKVMVFERAKPQ